MNNDICFLKHIFRNQYIKNQIYKHLNQSRLIIFKSRDELLNYQFRNYIYKLKYIFNKDIEIGDIPSSVKELYLECNNNSLRLNYNSIPSTVEILNIFIIQDIDFAKLPSSIHTLQVSGCYSYSSLDNQKSKSTIPYNIKTLRIGNSFNRSLHSGILDNGNLTLLSMGGAFNSFINTGVLPSTLTSLDMMSFNHPIDFGTLPSGLKFLKLYGFNNNAIVPGTLPPSLTFLYIGRYFKTLDIGTLPSTIETLILASFNNGGRSIIPSCIPASCTILDLGSIYNQELVEGVLPNGLTNLTISGVYNYEINLNVLPSSLRYLNLSSNFFNHIISNRVLPEGLEEISLGYNYDHLITRESIPSSVKKITMFKFKNDIKNLYKESYNNNNNNNNNNSINIFNIIKSIFNNNNNNNKNDNNIKVKITYIINNNQIQDIIEHTE